MPGEVPPGGGHRCSFTAIFLHTLHILYTFRQYEIYFVFFFAPLSLCFLAFKAVYLFLIVSNSIKSENPTQSKRLRLQWHRDTHGTLSPKRVQSGCPRSVYAHTHHKAHYAFTTACSGGSPSRRVWVCILCEVGRHSVLCEVGRVPGVALCHT